MIQPIIISNSQIVLTNQYIPSDDFSEMTKPKVRNNQQRGNIQKHPFMNATKSSQMQTPFFNSSPKYFGSGNSFGVLEDDMF